MISQRGLTLLELLITVAISAILLTVVAPNVSSILRANNVTSDINNISALLQHGRFSAVNDQQDVIVCPTSNYSSCDTSWALPKMVFSDVNQNGARDESEPLITTSDPVAKTNAVSGFTGALTFADNGGASQAATIVLCPTGGTARDASAVLITLYGKVTVAKDSNNDGIKEDASGTALSCS